MYGTLFEVSLGDVVDLKSRGCRKLKRGNTGVPMCMGHREVRFCCTAAAAVVPLLYCADAFEILRKC